VKKPRLPRRFRRIKVTGDFGHPRPHQVYTIDGKRYVLTHFSLDGRGELDLSFLEERFFKARYWVG
jgi:hypothetical protein